MKFKFFIFVFLLIFFSSQLLAIDISKVGIDNLEKISTSTPDILENTKDVQENLDENYLKKALNTSENIITNESSANKILEKNNINGIKLTRIFKIVKITEEEKREKITNELFNMSESFVEKFERYSTKKDVKAQLEQYEDVLTRKKRARLNIDNDNIQIFFKNKDADAFMRSLLNNN